MLVLAAARTERVIVSDGLSARDWIVAGVILAAGIILAQVLKAFLVRAVRRRDGERAAAEAVGRVAGSIALLGALVYALSVIGVRLGPLVGALGIGGLALAFAAQTILANFLGSIVLQVRRPFRRGDQVHVGDCEGTVEDVNFRTVVLRTYDGERVLVPCTKVLDNPIVNYTVLGRRRTTVAVEVAYDSDLDRARQVMLSASATADGVQEEPEPEAWVKSFEESGIELAVRFWHAPDIATLWRVRSNVTLAVKTALDEAGIQIPFPHRVVLLPASPDSREEDGAGADPAAERPPVSELAHGDGAQPSDREEQRSG
jgi:small conductance mechanosensitive channel